MGRGTWALVATAVLWSTSGLFIKLIDWHPVLIAGARAVLAAFFMLISRLVIHRGDTTILYKSLAVSVRSPAFWLSGIAYSATMLLFVAANKLTTSANAILLQYSAPIWTAFLGWVLVKEKPRIEHWFGILFVFAGLGIFFKSSLGGGALLGDALALGSGVVFAANSVFMRMQKEADPADGILLANILTALFALLFLNNPVTLTPKILLSILFMGCIQIGLSAVLFSFGMKKTSAIAAMLILSIEPILNPLWVFIVTGEQPSASAYIGGGIIVTAVLATNIISSRRIVQLAQ